MIIGEQATGILCRIRESHTRYFMTGSRFFGCYSKESDYDFFVSEPDAFEDGLLRDFFQLIHFGNDYTVADPSLYAVYQYEDSDVKIQVQVIRRQWFSAKVEANEFLQNLGIMPVLEKPSRNQVYLKVMEWFYKSYASDEI